MRYKQLGNTGMFVSEICLGAMTFGPSLKDRWEAIAGVAQDGVDRIVERSLAHGVNFIDTADVYSFGESEKLVGQSLKNLGVKRSDVVIATKFHAPVGSGPNDRGSSRGHIMDSVERSLERLQTDHIDLYQVHGSDPVTTAEETLRALDDLVSRGLVRYVGVSNWPAWRMAKALGISDKRGFARFETVQAYYSMVGRDLEREIVPFLNEEKLGLMVWSPLSGGFLSGKYGEVIDPGAGVKGRRTSAGATPVDVERGRACIIALREVAAKHGASMATVALAWVLAKPFVMSILIGARDLTQLDQNLASVSLTLDAEDIAKLDAASELPEEYPGWMLARQADGRWPAPFVPKA